MSENIVGGGADLEANGGAGSGEDKIKDKDKAFEALKTEKKALAEKASRLELELGKIQEQNKLKEEDALKQKGEYKALYERVQTEKKELDEKVKENEKQKLNLRKIDLILKEIGPLQKPEYFNFVELDRIPYDETTGDIDLNIAKQVASDFVKNYPELVRKKTGSMPGNAPSPSNTTTLTLESWKKLGTSTEMRARHKEIVKK